MPLNPRRLSPAQYSERYSGIKMLFDKGVPPSEIAKVVRMRANRVRYLLNRMGYRGRIKVEWRKPAA